MEDPSSALSQQKTLIQLSTHDVKLYKCTLREQMKVKVHQALPVLYHFSELNPLMS